MDSLISTKSLTKENLELILSTAKEFTEVNQRAIKKVPTLRGKTILNLFYEPSTRTKASFELAGKRLSADISNFSASTSSTTKGETFTDTLRTLRAMHLDCVVLRHPHAGAPHHAERVLEDIPVINAGDGLGEHPTQALLDLLTVQNNLGRVDKLKVLFVGDIIRSRVFKSHLHLHKMLGNEVRACGPRTLVPNLLDKMGVKYFSRLPEALDGADVVISLRVKEEYLGESVVPGKDFFARHYCLRAADFDKYCPKAIFLTPGPFIREYEVDSDLLSDERCCYEEQVAAGVSVRMAIFYLLLVGGKRED